MNLVIWLLTFVLVVLSVFLVLLVLMQKSKSDGGVGAALGGGMTEATFGPETGNVLATLTRNGTIAFFVICFGLYLAQIAVHRSDRTGTSLPEIPVAPAPAATSTAPVALPDAAAPIETPTPAVALPDVAAPSATETVIPAPAAK
jgi:preprotein translocase subunit SecG